MINVSEIFNIESSRKNNKKEIYKKIFEQFSRKIRCTVELGGKSVMLRVPFIVFGYPTFDRSRACVYLKKTTRTKWIQCTKYIHYRSMRHMVLSSKR